MAIACCSADGAFYVVPGSHRRGRIQPSYDENTSYKFWAVGNRDRIEVLRSSPPPVPIVGPAGTCVFFYCNLLHASGHNLSAEDWVVSRNIAPLSIETSGTEPELVRAPSPI